MDYIYASLTMLHKVQLSAYLFFILITLAVILLLLQSSNLNTYLHHNGSTLGEENKNIKKGANKVSSEPKNILDFVKLLALNN